MAGKGYDVALFGGTGFWPDIVVLKNGTDEDDKARNGIHCDRPKVEIDLRPAVAMLEKGHGLGVTAKAMGVARSTLRRRLLEAGALG